MESCFYSRQIIAMKFLDTGAELHRKNAGPFFSGHTKYYISAGCWGNGLPLGGMQAANQTK